jgi:hypothetical protein
VARGVAYAEEDRLVFALGFIQRLGSPRVPVDWVVGMLKEVGAGLVGEAIRHSGG